MIAQEENAAPCPCPVCRRSELLQFFVLREIPLQCNVLWRSREEAVAAPRGDLELVFCRTCGHVYNRAFRSELMEYSEAYENSLHFSPFFQDYAQGLAQKLLDRHQLTNKHVVEIGCGKGDFLKLLCRMGNNRGTGFDPSFSHERTSDHLDASITFVQDYYSKAHGTQGADLIVCRHVLEHIPQPLNFLTDLRRAINGNGKTPVFFEVPNALFILEDLSIFDLIYEHCSYFTLESLTTAFEMAGFQVTAVESAFGGQFLTLEGLACDGPCPSIRDAGRHVREYQEHVESFAGRFEGKVNQWSRRLDEIRLAGSKALVWGAGSKGAGFLNMTPGASVVEYVVDINPHKEGKYVAGTGQRIVSPEFLSDYRPELILVMNPIYLPEIRRQVTDMGLSPKFLAV